MAALPPGADVMVKAMSSDTNTYHYRDVVVKAMPVALPGIVVKSTMHPPLPLTAAMMAPAPAMASVIALAPASSKAEAISLATGPVDMEDAATEEASPITPPGIEHPLVELGTRAPGTPGSAFGVVEPWTDPDDISQRSSTSTSIAEEDAVSEAATAMSAEEAATAMPAKDAAAATAIPAVQRLFQQRMRLLQRLCQQKMRLLQLLCQRRMLLLQLQDAAALCVSAVRATFDTIIDGIDVRDL